MDLMMSNTEAFICLSGNRISHKVMAGFWLHFLDEAGAKNNLIDFGDDLDPITFIGFFTIGRANFDILAC